MNNFTYFELLMLNELVVREQDKYRKTLEFDLRKSLFKVFRPGLFKRLQMLLELEKKLNFWGLEARKVEEENNE